MHKQVLKAVTNGDLVATLPKKKSSSSWKQGGELSLCAKLIDWSPTNGGPQEGAGGSTLSLLDGLANCLLFCLLFAQHWAQINLEGAHYIDLLDMVGWCLPMLICAAGVTLVLRCHLSLVIAGEHSSFLYNSASDCEILNLLLPHN